MSDSQNYYRGECVFSAGGVLVNKSTKRVFLIYKNSSNEWLLPKGRLETGETVEGAASREIFEETGYENTVGGLLSVQVRRDVVDPTKTKIIFWFLSEVVGNKSLVNTQEKNESFGGGWFSVEEALDKLSWESDIKLVRMIRFG